MRMIEDNDTDVYRKGLIKNSYACAVNGNLKRYIFKKKKQLNCIIRAILHIQDIVHQAEVNRGKQDSQICNKWVYDRHTDIKQTCTSHRHT